MACRPAETFGQAARLYDFRHPRVAPRRAAAARPAPARGGALGLSNFGPGDRSAFFKRWATDWPLVHRSRAELRDLFAAADAEVTSEVSADGSLSYAFAF